MKKIMIVVVYLTLLLVGFMYNETLVAWIQDDETSFIALMVLLSIFLAIIPVVPFTLFGGIMGIKYGLLVGFFINLIGAVSAATFYYLMSRFLFADYFKAYAKRSNILENVSGIMRKNTFISILIARMLYIVPYPVINIYSGVNKIPFPVYFVATLIGTSPPMFILAFGGDKLFSDFRLFLLGMTCYFLFLLFVYVIYRYSYKNVKA